MNRGPQLSLYLGQACCTPDAGCQPSLHSEGGVEAQHSGTSGETVDSHMVGLTSNL